MGLEPSTLGPARDLNVFFHTIHPLINILKSNYKSESDRFNNAFLYHLIMGWKTKVILFCFIFSFLMIMFGNFWIFLAIFSGFLGIISWIYDHGGLGNAFRDLGHSIAEWNRKRIEENRRKAEERRYYEGIKREGRAYELGRLEARRNFNRAERERREFLRDPFGMKRSQRYFRDAFGINVGSSRKRKKRKPQFFWE